MSFETASKILETVELLLENEESDSGDDEIIYNLLECCEVAMQIPKRKKRETWVADWRAERPENGSYAFLTKELGNEEDSFKKYLRMNEEQFNKIVSLIENDIKKADTILREAISPAEKLTATLRYLATGDSLQNTNYHTRLSQSFLSTAIPKVCTAICKNLQNEYMKFPTTRTEWEIIAENFLIKWQFPLCLGAIDGKHILFKPTRRIGTSYYNFQGIYSIVLLALVDANCRFIYIAVGRNRHGNMDACDFLQSKLKKVIYYSETNFPREKTIGKQRMLPYVFVGDDAVPLEKHILKPYPAVTTDKKEKIFNIRMSRARHVVDDAFEMLTNRFRILQKRINLSPEKVELITKTCCLLHNFLMDDENLPVASETSVPPTLNSVVSSVQDENTRNGPAEAVRESFMQYFNGEGKVDWQDSKL